MRTRNWLPQFLPGWVKERIAAEDYSIKQFVRQAASRIMSDALVLDAGAGEGQYKLEFTHTCYISVDLTVGDERWNYGDLDAFGDLHRLPFRQDVFDAVICTQVLEHVPEPLRVLMEIHRVLKPGGQLFLTVPQSWHQHQKPYDFYRYTSFGIRYLVEQAGLSIESINPMGGYFWFLSFQLRNLDYWLFPKSMIGRRWVWPLRALLIPIFQLILPLILFYMDHLDRAKDETFGHMCVAIKPHET